MKSGSPSIRYMRGADTKERIQKIYLRFGSDTFTVRDLKEEVLPDTNSGEIIKWESSSIIESVGMKDSVHLWKLSDMVINIIKGEI